MKALHTLLMATAVAGLSTAALAEGTTAYDGQTQQPNPPSAQSSQMNDPAGQTGSEAAIDVQTQLSANDIEDVQQILSDRGYALEVDGVWGNNTAAAVRQFQAQNGLPVTGTLTASTLSALGADNATTNQ